jgi:membrane associated rhomboid family serine protease
MGIHDRDYYPDETRGSGWLSGVAPACSTIILINVGVYLAQVVFKDANLDTYFAASSDQVFDKFRIYQLWTAAFLHDPGNPFHIIWNMLFLWMAGREVESIYGSREFTITYLMAAGFSTLCFVLLDRFGVGRLHLPMMGASGAVFAIVVIYTLYNPRREILFFFVLPIEMWLLVVIYLGCDFVFLMQQLHGGTPDVLKAFAAHLGGAGFGYVYKVSGFRWTSLPGLGARRLKPRLRVVRPDLYDRDVDLTVEGGAPSRPMTPSSPSRPSAVAGVPDEQFEARLDEVLAKIGREGPSGLTDEENRILQEASRRARDRRSDRVR